MRTERFAGALRRCLILSSLGLLAACASVPNSSEPVDPGTAGLVEWYGRLGGLNGDEWVARKAALQQRSGEPETQLRLAMLLSHPRNPAPEPKRARELLDDLAGAKRAGAADLQPLIRLLADQLAERQRLAGLLAQQSAERARQDEALERQAVQLKESQRRVQELQEKLQRLADIERSLGTRQRPAGGAR